MSNSTIPAIPTTAAASADDDYMELGGATNLSRKILTKNLTGGRVMAWGVATLTGANTNPRVVVNFGSTLPTIPDHVEIEFAKLDAAPDVPVGVLAVDQTSTTQFVIQLTGTLSDGTSYFVYWKALAL